MLARYPGKPIAKYAPMKFNQFRIMIGDAVEKRQPLRTLPARRYGCHFRAIISAAMRAHLPCAQVNSPARRVQQPGIGIPLICGASYAPVGTGKAYNGCNGLAAAKSARRAGITASCRRLPADIQG